MKGGEVGVAFGDGERAEREAHSDAVDGVGWGCGRYCGAWDSNLNGGRHGEEGRGKEEKSRVMGEETSDAMGDKDMRSCDHVMADDADDLYGGTKRHRVTHVVLNMNASPGVSIVDLGKIE